VSLLPHAPFVSHASFFSLSSSLGPDSLNFDQTATPSATSPRDNEADGNGRDEEGAEGHHDSLSLVQRRVSPRGENSWRRLVAFNIFIVNSMNRRHTIGKRSINEFRRNEEWG